MKELHRRGRPKLDENIVKNQYIRVRVTTKETRMIEDHCEQNNISISNFLRESISRFINE